MKLSDGKSTGRDSKILVSQEAYPSWLEDLPIASPLNWSLVPNRARDRGLRKKRGTRGDLVGPRTEDRVSYSDNDADFEHLGKPANAKT